MKHTLLYFFSATAISHAVVSIDYATVGHAGNPADPFTGGIYGAVAYNYKIGKHEVTNGQYTEFLNTVDPTGTNPNEIYDPSMGSDARGGISFNATATNGEKYAIRTNMGDKPVNYVRWHDAARFTNWLNNGQGNATTESGAYTLIGNTGFSSRNSGPNVTVWLPSENEWYKAAYYDPTVGAGGGDNYWAYGTKSDTLPTVATANGTGQISNSGLNVANYNSGADWNGVDGNLTNVGSATARSYFGTYDQTGNISEYTDVVLNRFHPIFGFYQERVIKDAESIADPSVIGASTRRTTYLNDYGWWLGFRVAGVPEPSTLVLTLLSSVGLICRRKR